MTDPTLRLVSALGLVGMIAIAWVFSTERRLVPWRVIGWGLGLQLALALLLLKTAFGRTFFVAVNQAVAQFIGFTDAGVAFVFGPLQELGFSFVLDVLPIIIFMGSLFAMLNGLVGWVGGLLGFPDLTLQWILGVLFAPFALLMGIPWAEAVQVGSLLGVKTVLNEFLAFRDLGVLIEAGALSPRSVVIASYALCGFANFGSLAILLGGVGGMAPSRRGDLARLGLRSILAGTLATMMTGCVAGILL